MHKTANVLNKLPKSLHGKAKRALQDIWMAETKNDAVAALDAFAESYAPKYEKAVECLTKDREALLAFYDFPAEHWKHLRSTDEMDKRFFVTSQISGDLLQVCSLVRSRRRRSFVATAHVAAAARRNGQGWPRLARPPQGLALIGPSTAACSIVLPGAGDYCCRARATSWRRAARRLQASPGRLICALPI